MRWRASCPDESLLLSFAHHGKSGTNQSGLRARARAHADRPAAHEPAERRQKIERSVRTERDLNTAFRPVILTVFSAMMRAGSLSSFTSALSGPIVLETPKKIDCSPMTSVAAHFLRIFLHALVASSANDALAVEATMNRFAMHTSASG